MTADAAPPQLSPDGYWWWTGEEWVPAAQLFAARTPPAAQYTPVEQYVTSAQPVEQYAVAAQIPVQQSWQQPVQQLPVFEILPGGPAPAHKPSRLRSTIAGTVAAVVLVSAGAAFGVNHYLGGGGQQPEDVLPANAAAMVKVDLDPSLSQKAALYRLGRSFPQLRLRGEDSVKDDLLRPLFTNPSMSYDSDVKPWLGDRAAVAAVPDGSPDGFAPVAAVQFTDKDKAKRTLLAASARAATGSDPFFFAFSGDYAVIASTQAQADSYARTTTHLADSSSYTKAMDSLGGDQIAVGWGDVRRLYDGFAPAARKANPFFGNLRTAPTGAFVVGLHAGSSYLELQGKAVDLTEGLAQVGASQFGQARTANLIGSFPNDTFAAFEATGLGDVVSRAYAVLPPPIKDAADGLGLRMPGDLAAILGTDTAVGLTGNITAPDLIAKVNTGNPVAATRALEKLSRTMRDSAPWCPCDGPALTTAFTAKSGYVVTSDPHAKTRGSLGSTPSFSRALPDAKTAGFVLYLNVRGLPPELMGTVQGLDAIGMSVQANGSFRLRLTTS